MGKRLLPALFANAASRRSPPAAPSAVVASAPVRRNAVRDAYPIVARAINSAS